MTKPDKPKLPDNYVPPRIVPNKHGVVPTAVVAPTPCAYCGVETSDGCVRDVRVELLTGDKRLVAEISLNSPGRRNFFCTMACVENAARDIMAEANNPVNPDDPIFPEVRKEYRGRVSRFRLGYVDVRPAGEGSGADVREDVHGAGYRRVTTPGFEDKVVNNPR